MRVNPPNTSRRRPPAPRGSRRMVTVVPGWEQATSHRNCPGCGALLPFVRTEIVACFYCGREERNDPRTVKS
jgi:hypothetical protein